MSQTDNTLLSTTEDVFVEATVEDRLIKNVVLCGSASRNGYSFPETAFGDVKNLYVGAPVFINHGKGKGVERLDRDTRDLAGTVTDARIINGKVYGDVVAYENRSGDDLISFSKRPTRGVGFSQTAHYDLDDKAKSVRKINRVFSVDLVINPATTNTFFENEGKHVPDTDSVAFELLTTKNQELTHKAVSLESANETLKSDLQAAKDELATLKLSLESLQKEKGDLEVAFESFKAEVSAKEFDLAVESELLSEGIAADSPLRTESWMKFLKTIEKPEDRKAEITLRLESAKPVSGSAPITQERKKPAATPEKQWSPAEALTSLLA